MTEQVNRHPQQNPLVKMFSSTFKEKSKLDTHDIHSWGISSLNGIYIYVRNGIHVLVGGEPCGVALKRRSLLKRRRLLKEYSKDKTIKNIHALSFITQVNFTWMFHCSAEYECNWI